MKSADNCHQTLQMVFLLAMNAERNRFRAVKEKHIPRISGSGVISKNKTKVGKYMLILLSVLWSCRTLMQDGAKDVAVSWQRSAGLRQGAGGLLCSHNWRWHLECAITHILSFLISTGFCNPAAPATIYCWGWLNSSCRLLGLNIIIQTHTYAEHPHLQMNAKVAKKKKKLKYFL